MNTYQIEKDPLAVGLTKPPCKFGVPMIAFYLNILGCLFGWMLFQALSGNGGFLSIVGFFCVGLLVFAVMSFMTLRDPFGLAIFWLNFTHFKKHRSNPFWGNMDTFAP